MEVQFQNNLEGVTIKMLNGFFVDWPTPPGPEDLYTILKNSAYLTLAIANDKVVGFVYAISDKVFSAYIPLLEVLPEFQHKGIAKELMKGIMKQTEHLYMVDLCCDDKLCEFYTKKGFVKSNGMLFRNYEVLKK